MNLMYFKIHKERGFYLLAILLLVINLCQAGFTELSNDEAYYWMYANHLDFGYFDHPPMIALMIKMGYSIFPNELGVRLISVLMGFGSLLILRRLVGGKKPLLIFMSFTAMALFQLYGFIAVPDSPLFFFFLLFLYQYREFLKDPSAWRAILLGLVVALLLYSKYHAILVLFFVTLSNLRLFLNPKFYIVIVSALAFYLPHIYWQIINDYPSYTFHMLSKSHETYNPIHTLEYLGGLVVIFGPLIIYWLVRYGCAKSSTDHYERAIQFIGFGFLVFFLIATLNGHGELNWAASSGLCFLILALRNQNFQWNQGLKIAIGFSLFFILIFRVHLAWPLLPEALIKKSEFHNGQTWAHQIKSKSEGRPVVFINSYQNASKYAFYSGDVSHSMNNSRYRRNQYDLWPMEEELRGKDVFIVLNWHVPSFDSIPTIRKTYSCKMESNYVSYSKLSFDLKEEKTIKMKAGESRNIPFVLTNNYPEGLVFDDMRSTDLYFEIIKEGKLLSSTSFQNLNGQYLKPGMTDKMIPIQAPDEPGVYFVKIVIQSRWIPPFINSRFIKLEVE